MQGSAHDSGYKGEPGLFASNFFLPSLPEVLASMLRLVVVALFVLGFIVQPFMIPSESMERSLLVGDFLLVNKEIYAQPGIWKHLMPSRGIERGDIIVFHNPLDVREYLVKRVIGLPGDHVRIEHGHAVINGQALSEPYVAIEPAVQNPLLEHFPQAVYSDPNVDLNWWTRQQLLIRNGELVIPAGKFFVLGDNRNHSQDSRYWGFVERREIVATPLVIYFSLRRPSRTDIDPASVVVSAREASVSGAQSGDDRLRKTDSPLNRWLRVVRWERILRIVR